MSEGKQAKNAWGVLMLLFAANLLNFFDRTIPAILIEPIRFEWSLSDIQLGIIAAAFTVVYAMAGLPMGRLADKKHRGKILGWGLSIWSLLTAASGLAQGFISFLFVRVGVGIGEATCAPAVQSLIGDLFPTHKRARAVGVFMLGLPLGLMLAFFTTGGIAKAFGTWRAPYFVAAVPGLLVAILMFFIKEPRRGAAEEQEHVHTEIKKPISLIIRKPTVILIILTGITMNSAAYAANGFLVPMMQRTFGLTLIQAAFRVGIIVGLTGLIGLLLGGWVADKLHRHFKTGRLMLGSFGVLLASIATYIALRYGGTPQFFTLTFAIGWLCSYTYYTCVYPALQDVVQPQLRGTTMALYFAAMYLLGGAFGPVVVGGLSDYFANQAMIESGAAAMSEQFKAVGLHDAMYLVPLSLFLTSIPLFIASLTFVKDLANLKNTKP